MHFGGEFYLEYDSWALDHFGIIPVHVRPGQSSTMVLLLVQYSVLPVSSLLMQSGLPLS